MERGEGNPYREWMRDSMKKMDDIFGEDKYMINKVGVVRGMDDILTKGR